jgi:hypothetical protein
VLKLTFDQVRGDPFLYRDRDLATLEALAFTRRGVIVLHDSAQRPLKSEQSILLPRPSLKCRTMKTSYRFFRTAEQHEHRVVVTAAVRRTILLIGTAAPTTRLRPNALTECDA